MENKKTNLSYIANISVIFWLLGVAICSWFDGYLLGTLAIISVIIFVGLEFIIKNAKGEE